MGPSDAAWLAQGARRLFDAPANVPALRAYLADRSNIFLLASERETALGFLRGTSLRQISTARKQMFLYEVSVAPKFRRRGVGTALIDRLLRYCRTRRYEEAFVLTEPRNFAAVRLYRRTGAATETRGDRMFVYRMADRGRRDRPPS